MDDIIKLNSESYSYDAVGNRQTGPDKFDAYTYDNGNELLTAKEQHLKNAQNEYDANGNLIKKTEATGHLKTITTYTYDDENRLTGVEIIKQNGSGMRRTYAFAYDPFGRRISKTLERDDFDVNILNPHKEDYPHITYYVYDGQNIIAEYDQNGKQTASYIHGPNIDEPLVAEIRNNRIYYHADGLGTITSLTNHMGMTVQKYDYDSFGNIKFTPFTHWIKQPFTYTGREFDHETGLYYYRARYYDPKAGRFITRDPIGFGGGINLFLYASANPLRMRDPMGLWAQPVHYLIIDEFFGGCPDILSIMIKVNDYMDRFSNQGNENSYQHAMRDPNDSISVATSKIRNFISNKLSDYIQNQNVWSLGEVFHTISDSTCPVHMNQQTGDPLVLYPNHNFYEQVGNYLPIKEQVLSKIRQELGSIINNLCCKKK